MARKTKQAVMPRTWIGVAVTGWMLACGPAADRSASSTDSGAPWDDSLRVEVVRMRDSDQEVRGRLVEALQAGSAADSAAMDRLAAEQDSLDRANAERLQEIIDRHGWPRRDLVGSEAAGAAFLLVQHATHDPAFQKEYLAFLEEEYRAGRAPGEGVALLTDRIRQAEGKRQLYGTQATVRNGELVVDPIANPEEVDARRAELGLPPLAEYVRELERAYGLAE